MGSLILCHKEKAKQPYEIQRVHIKIYTIEELCYYICNNLYLIDYTLMNRQICEWVRNELRMEKLADEMMDVLVQNGSEEQFVLRILTASNIYSQGEINKVQVLMEQLAGQKDVEKAKFKADTLLEAGEYSAAVLIYQSIVSRKHDDSVSKEFYGKVYACLGTSYGRLFLYEEAAKAYKEAYEICGDADMLRAYLYSCKMGYPPEDYVKMLSGNSIFLSMDSLLKEETAKNRAEMEEAALPEEEDISPEEQLEKWKSEYRKNRQRF